MSTLPISKRTVFTASVLVAVLLAGCGGGSSSSSSTDGSGESTQTSTLPDASTVAPPSSDQQENVTTVATESSPIGPQVDLAGDGYMPLVDGSQWSYGVQDQYGNEIRTMDRSLKRISSDASMEVLQFINQDNAGTILSFYVKKADGLYFDFSRVTNYPKGAAGQMGLVRAYAFPTYAVGERRIVVREGTWDQDLDGDGQYERFRLEYTQEYKGQEQMALPWDSTATVAKFTNSYRLTVTTSKAPQQYLGSVITRDEYFAKNVGAVKLVERTDTLSGEIIYPTETFLIKTASVNGVSYGPAKPSPAPETLVKVDLTHNDVVYDAPRNRYYASVPSSVIGKGNSIAIIDPQTGAVSFSSPVGSNPNTMSLSPDGKYLYVGLEGAGQVVKLSLPGLTEVARISLGSDSFYGTYFAESIAISPANSDIIAVSLKSKNVSPRHLGVILINGTTIMPKKTQGHTGSNLVTFNDDGTVLYGYNTESTEYGLRKIDVAADGLTEVKVVSTSGPFSIRNLQYDSGKIYLAASLYSPIDLTLVGQFKQYSSVCRPLQSSVKVACLPSLGDSQQVTVYDANSLVAQAAIPISFDASYLKNMVPGPQGTIAISYGEAFAASSTLYLLKDQSL